MHEMNSCPCNVQIVVYLCAKYLFSIYYNLGGKIIKAENIFTKRIKPPKNSNCSKF